MPAIQLFPCSQDLMSIFCLSEIFTMVLNAA